MKITRIKKTKQIVVPVDKVGEYTWCLFKFENTSNAGNNGVVQLVRNDNLIED